MKLWHQLLPAGKRNAIAYLTENEEVNRGRSIPLNEQAIILIWNSEYKPGCSGFSPEIKQAALAYKPQPIFEPITSTTHISEIVERAIKFSKIPTNELERLSEKDLFKSINFFPAGISDCKSLFQYLQKKQLLPKFSSSFSFESSPDTRTTVIRTKHVLYVGDTHGDLETSKKIFTDIGQKILAAGGVIILVGDYVDRGRQSLANFLFWLYLKEKYPDQIIMLRGNHETEEMNRKYGKSWYPQLVPKAKTAIKTIYSQLPISAIRLACTGNSLINAVLAIHGGSMYLATNSPLKDKYNYMVGAYFSESNNTNSPLWNEFKEYIREKWKSTIEGTNARKGGYGKIAGKRIVEILKTLGFSSVVTGHTHENEDMFDSSVHTLMSTGKGSNDSHFIYKNTIIPEVIYDRDGKLIRIRMENWKFFRIQQKQAQI